MKLYYRKKIINNIKDSNLKLRLENKILSNKWFKILDIKIL